MKCMLILFFLENKLLIFSVIMKQFWLGLCPERFLVSHA